MTAFEERQLKQVLGAFIHVDICTIAWAIAFRNLRPFADQMPFLPMAGKPYDDGRNSCVKAFLESDYQHLFFLDTDVTPPSDCVSRLLAHNLPIVSGLYHRRSPPHSLPVMIKNGSWYVNHPPGLVEVDLVGAGCLLVHRSVYERVPPQRPGKSWYDWRIDLKDLDPPIVEPDSCLSEDFSWNRHVRKHGYKIMVDTTIDCGHVGLGEARRGTFLPAEARMFT